MATTVTAPVSNVIALAEKYLPILDEIYKVESRSAILDTAAERVRWDGAKKAYLFNTEMVGLGNYDRNAGFVPGDVNTGWEDYEITQDRGRSFLVDVMDNDETLGMAFGTLVGEFQRTQEVPELDAYRFAKYASGAAVSQIKTETPTAATIVGLIDDATATLDDAEVPYEGRILFVNPQTYKLIKGGITRMVMNDDRNVNYNVVWSFVQNRCIASNNIGVVRLQHSVRSNLVDYVQEALYLCKRELNTIVDFATTHKFNISYLCVYKNTCITKWAQYNSIGLPTLDGSVGSDTLYSLLFTNNANW